MSDVNVGAPVSRIRVEFSLDRAGFLALLPSSVRGVLRVVLPSRFVFKATLLAFDGTAGQASRLAREIIDVGEWAGLTLPLVVTFNNVAVVPL